jgi:hypothetical protein
MTWFERIAERRRPEFVIGSPDAPYLLRWWLLPRNRVFNIYLHRILRNDDDRALHDHPWWNLSYLLSGSYTEHVIEQGGVHKALVRAERSMTFRRASRAHRLELHDGPAWSLFFTGPVIREWGFHCPAGWRPWQLFVSARDKGQVGRGCN